MEIGRYTFRKFDKEICLREEILENQVVLHSDNGGAMKGATMLATLQRLGIVPSFSRPSVSDDNPFLNHCLKLLNIAHRIFLNHFLRLTMQTDG